MAAFLKDDYIYSHKPNPAMLAVEAIDEDLIRDGLRQFYKKTKGCHVELIMKDNHTLGNNPDNIVRWARIAREEAISR